MGIRHFLEVFNPNAPVDVAPEDVGAFVNDSITPHAGRGHRGAAAAVPEDGLQRRRTRWPSWLEYDPSLVVGILGGSAGTTRDTFELLHQAERHGARVALFGRKIQHAESQLDLVGLMRPVLRGELSPADAVRAYHDALAKAEHHPAPRPPGRPGGDRPRAACRMSRGRRGSCAPGSIVVDVAKVIDAYPPLDHLAMIEQVSLSTGGPGLNMAVDLRMLGASFPIGVLGAVGDDEHGAFVLAECARLDIEITGVGTLAGRGHLVHRRDDRAGRRPPHVLPPQRG